MPISSVISKGIEENKKSKATYLDSIARSADAWCPSSGLAEASPGGEKFAVGLVALVAHPIPIPVEFALGSIPG